jgi:hypothetical protein
MPSDQAVAGGRLLPIPPPYSCWVALSNDPDGTTMWEWECVHRLVWEDLRLPFADSFFLFSYNERYPDQVCVERNPDILAAHPHDTMHTWGDFCETSARVFTRADARAGLELLRSHGATPRVWVDHATFHGNLLHRPPAPAQPTLRDASGHAHENLAYSLDLIEQAGVRYVWDGSLTSVVGQDRPLRRRDWYAARYPRRRWPRLVAAADLLGKPLWRAVDARAFDYDASLNSQYREHCFGDGRTFYAFRRHGRWELADIDGLARIIEAPAIAALARTRGTMVVYTHLGKRNGDRSRDGRHVPRETEAALRGLAAMHRDGVVMLSSVSRLLDYLVVRDSCIVAKSAIDFRADGVRFRRLTPSDLVGSSFGFRGDGARLDVTCEGAALPCDTSQVAEGTWRIDVR